MRALPEDLLALGASVKLMIIKDSLGLQSVKYLGLGHAFYRAVAAEAACKGLKP